MNTAAARSRTRKQIVGLAALAAVDSTLGSLVQTGVIRRLPDLPFPGVDSQRVMMLRAAFPFGIPDAPIALGLNALVMALAGVANRGTGSRRRVMDIALAGVALGGALGVVRYFVEMFRLRRICAYCVVAGAMLAMVPLAVRNARLASRPIRQAARTI